MIIDSHQHFWSLKRGDYHWLTPDLKALYRDFSPTDLAPCLEGAGVSATVLVQAAPTEAETRFLLDIAKSTPFVAGVVGWVDMEAPDAHARLVALKEYGDGYLKGVRPMIQEIADNEWILSPKLDAAFEALIELDLKFDALVLPPQLPPLLQRLKRHPALDVVVDHGAKPPNDADGRSRWSADMASIAQDTRSYCKLSGLATLIGESWETPDITPVANDILRLFGADRVMWGSDWPVLTLAADYQRWFETARALTNHLGAEAQVKIFGTNAARFYSLNIEEVQS